MKKLKNKLSLITLGLISLFGCTAKSSEENNVSNNNSVTESSSDTSATVNEGSSIDSTIYSGQEVTSTFEMTSEDGKFTNSGNTYTITSGGVYSLSGKLENGQIYVSAGESDVVEIDLNGVTITNSSNSPIFVYSADKVEISAKADTYNVITDSRSNKTSDSESQGEGAIYAKTDLKLKGNGVLVLTGNYNNGVSTTKDLTIQNQSLHVKAYNNAIKGNHSVTIKSGNILAYSSNGDGIKSEDTDLSSSGKQRGNIDIAGGNIEIYSKYDGIDAAYDANIYNSQDDSGNTIKPSVTVYTNTYMSYGSNYSFANGTKSKYVKYRGGAGGNPGGNPFPGEGGQTGPGSGTGNSSKASESAKGIKAANQVYIKGGSNYFFAYDDGVHSNGGTSFDSGKTGAGNIEIAGGNTTIFASDDGIHASNKVILSGGESTVGCAYEGVEAGVNLVISGGTHYAYASDDGLNSSGSSGGIDVTGGTMFVAVPTSGDVDTIDSNGYYKQSGGVVIAIGPSQNMASTFDVDGTKQVSGGSLICFGNLESKPTAGSGVTNSSKSGTYKFTSSITQKITFSNNTSITGLYLTISDSTTANLATAGTLSSTVCNAYSANGSISSVTQVS